MTSLLRVRRPAPRVTLRLRGPDRDMALLNEDQAQTRLVAGFNPQGPQGPPIDIFTLPTAP